MATEVLTGPGRIVWGHPMRVSEKKIQEGPNKGQPVLKKDGTKAQQWVFGVAFPKAEFATIWAAMEAEARTGYPNGVPPRFAWKFKDGDGVDNEGKPYASREGYAGCYVLTVSTESFAPSVFKFENGAYRQLAENEIKTGDYVVLKLNFVVNVATGTLTPSVYVNPQAIQLVGYGKEIVSASVNPMEAFGGRQYQLPPGASATPISSAPVGHSMPGAQPPMQPGQMPGQPAPGGYAPNPQQGYGMPGQPAPGGYVPPTMQPAPGTYPPAPGGYGMPPPAHDFVQNAGAQPGQMPGQPAPGGYAPPQQPGGYAPPQQPGGYAPPQQPGGYAPPQQPGGYAPPQQPGMMPGQMPPR